MSFWYIENYYQKDGKDVFEDRWVAYCKDPEEYEKFVREQRGIGENEKLIRKVTMDGGGGSFKICLSLQLEKGSNDLLKEAKKFKDSSGKFTC